MLGKLWSKAKEQEAFFPLSLALLSGLATFVFGYLGFITVENVMPPSWEAIWKQWDSMHYLTIARQGYSGPGFLICFFPLYPLSIWLLSLIIPNPLVAALLISNVAFAVGLYFLYRLVRLDFERKIAEMVVIFCVCFPTAYFFHVAYSESLFFALAVGSVYLARKEQWWMAGALSFLAALTRLPGLVLAAALLVEYLDQRRFRLSAIRFNIVAVTFPLLGFGTYLLINHLVFGNPLQFLETFGSHFDRHLSLPFTGIINSWNGIFFSQPTKRFTIWGANLVFFALSTLVLGWCLLRLRRSYAVYGLAIWALTFCLNFWLSVPRFIMMLFPMFIAAAILTEKRPTLRYSVLFTSVFLYTLGTIQFVRGWWSN